MSGEAGGINRRGSRNGASKLSEKDVRYIRANYGHNGPGSNVSNVYRLAARFKIHKRTVIGIANGETWGWLE